MKVAELIARREVQWKELEKLCSDDKKSLRKDPEKLVRFSELYRGTCADLALAEATNFPLKRSTICIGWLRWHTISCIEAQNTNGKNGSKFCLKKHLKPFFANRVSIFVLLFSGGC